MFLTEEDLRSFSTNIVNEGEQLLEKVSSPAGKLIYKLDSVNNSLNKEQKPSKILLEHFDRIEEKEYDIFLSHSFSDADLVLSLYLKLKRDFNLKVFVDWIDAKELDKNRVTKETVNKIKSAMQNSKNLIYAISLKADMSRWMPWELGFYDGYHKDKINNISILPIGDYETTSPEFKNQEFIKIYPFITYEGIKGKEEKTFFLNEYGTEKYVQLIKWINEEKQPYLH